jgi:hypothetical protein
MSVPIDTHACKGVGIYNSLRKNPGTPYLFPLQYKSHIPTLKKYYTLSGFLMPEVVFEGRGERKNPPTGGGVNHEINCLFRFLQYYFQNA